MSDEKEPVVYSLEEAMRAVHWERLDELRDAHGNLADVQLEITEDGWWVFLNRDGKSKNEIKEFDEWEDAASFALDKKVISRERVMREAIREYLEAYIEDLEYHAGTLITTDEEAEESNRRRERHMKALSALQAINNGEGAQVNTTKTERVFMWTFKASFDGYLNKLSVSIGVKASSQKAAEDAAREALGLERERRGEMLLALTEVTEVHP